MLAPLKSHLDVDYKILRYLKGSPRIGLLFQKGEELKLEAYTNTDWTGSKTDRRSTTGCCTFKGGNLVSWRSRKQPVVARSSAEGKSFAPWRTVYVSYYG